MNNKKFIVITGLSGAGKTQAIRCLEDLGFFCVDNLPAALIPKFIELIKQSAARLDKVGVVMDIRGGKFFNNIQQALFFLNQQNIKFELIFLEASAEALVRRFKETRRRHPLSPDKGILEGIVMEKQMLESIRENATRIIDTSDLSNRQLRQKIIHLLNLGEKHKMIISIVSFGYKYGIPLDADLVMDVRFIPNPFYVPELKNLTGQNKEVQDYVLASEETKIFSEKFADMLNFLIPYYIKEGKSQLVIAIGCTGGQHRSVTLVNELQKSLKNPEYKIVISHRDIERNVGKKK